MIRGRKEQSPKSKIRVVVLNMIRIIPVRLLQMPYIVVNSFGGIQKDGSVDVLPRCMLIILSNRSNGRSYNSECEGGLMDYAFQFAVKNNGIDTEEDYPYQGGERSCNKNKLKRHVTIDGYIDVPEKDEKQLLHAVAAQPVSVCICGSDRGFQLYSKGIFTGPCSSSLDHAVLIVGYGSENGVDYWILKNSWGTKRGMDGYMYMQRNSGNPQGICGINMMASYPIKTSPKSTALSFTRSYET